MKENPNVKISISGGGSDDGIKALIGGTTELEDLHLRMKLGCLNWLQPFASIRGSETPDENLNHATQKRGRMIKNPTLIELSKRSDRLQIERNFECPEYDDCLTHAAFRDLDLLCRDCPLKDTKETAMFTDLEGYGGISLINSIFTPE